MQRWAAEQKWLVGRLRSAEMSHNRASYVANTLTVAAGNVVRSVVNDHDTISCFVSDVLDLERWQSLMILFTLLLCALLIQIWFYSSQSTICCAQLRAMLDDGSGAVCPPDPTLPCRGFAGDCSDIIAQFTGVQDAIPADYMCHAFPDPTSTTDGYLVGLITVAVCFPVTGILTLMFEMSNDVEMPEGWQEQPDARWKRLLLGGTDPVRGWNWHYPGTEDSRGRTTEPVLGRKRPVNGAYFWMLMNGETPALLLLWGWAQQLWATLTTGSGGEKGGEEEGDEAAESRSSEKAEEELEQAKHRGRQAQQLAALGIAGVVVTWAIMVWFILASTPPR